MLERTLPAAESLTRRLRAVLGDGLATDDLLVVDREPLAGGTFPKEVVTCDLGGGRKLKVFCKYAAKRAGSYGHREGIAYEAEVYRRVLGKVSLSAPALLGWHVDPETGEQSLFLEYLEGSLRVFEAPEAMGRAAGWAGRFQAEAQGPILEGTRDLLIRYDEHFYAGWVRRTLAFARRAGRALPWLEHLAARYEELIPLLVASPPTIIHGEYTVKNVLTRGEVIMPTDWESAAVGAGEIDLACLTEGWADETVEVCVRAYERARWPDGAPTEFAARLETAVLYVGFRWLGQDPAAFLSDHLRWRLDSMRLLAQRVDAT